MRGREGVDAILADNASPEKGRETLAAVQRVVDKALRGIGGSGARARLDEGTRRTTAAAAARGAAPPRTQTQ